MISQYSSIDFSMKSIFDLLIGIENQTHCHCHEIAVFIHITSQDRFINGHHEFQGFIAASV